MLQEGLKLKYFKDYPVLNSEGYKLGDIYKVKFKGDIGYYIESPIKPYIKVLIRPDGEWTDYSYNFTTKIK